MECEIFRRLLTHFRKAFPKSSPEWLQHIVLMKT
jgi:hypothetical protein